MSKYTIYTVFDVQSTNCLKDIARLFEFVKAAADYKFNYSTDISKKGEFNLESSLETVAQNRCLAIENRSVSDILNFEKEDLYLSTGFDTVNWNLFLITMSSGCFSREKARRLQTVRDFVKFCEIAYRIFSPDYGYGLTNPEVRPIEPSNLQTVPNTVFDLNFFGQGLVKKIGKEKLLNCPTWRTVNFDNDGVLLELSEDPIEQSGDFRDNYVKTANILGVNRLDYERI